MESKQKPNKPSRISPTAWILLLALLAWNAWMLWPKTVSSATIPYTVFLTQVEAGNVSKVTINGDKISGTFVSSVTLPQPTEAPSSQVKPTQGPSQPAETPQPYTTFMTVFPQEVGDANLMPLLTEKNVEVNVVSTSGSLLLQLLSYGLPFLLLIGVMIWLSRRTQQSQSGIFNFGRSKARRYGEERPTITFKDVAGVNEAKMEVQELVDFLRTPIKYLNLGAKIPHGVLLVGPPGTGKTLLARAIAGEAAVPFFNISASEFVEMFVGVGASRVRDLFEQAKANSPAIVYIDELDAVGRRRGAGVGAVNDEREQTLNQLLVEMDGFDERQEIIVLASTNRPDVLDPAILRPGRFDRQVTVGLPDRIGREGILQIHTRPLRLAPDVNLDVLARTTTGFSGADLANLSNEAALIAARRDHQQVNMQDFEEALDRILLGATRALLLDDHDRRVIAYHEAGHALAAWLTPHADPVYKVTIIPHGQALGVTEQLPGDDRYNYSQNYLLARLAVMLAGRAAEEIAIGEITTGAENDLVQATSLARRMVTRWGMGSLGLIALATDENQPFLGYEMTQARDYSETTAARVDQDVLRILDESFQSVRRLLDDSRNLLDKLVEALLKDETVGRETLQKILGERAVQIFIDRRQEVKDEDTTPLS